MNNVLKLKFEILFILTLTVLTACEKSSDSDSNGGIPGVDGFVHSIAVSGDNVYAGGSFLRAGGELGNANISKWDGTNWAVLDNGVESFVRSIALNGSDVYIAGAFENAGSFGNVSALHIARWDGSGWNALGSGINANWPYYVNVITYSGNSLFAGGSFSEAGGVSANNIAMWDGTNWNAMAEGVNGIVNTIIIDGDGDVYVGGDFTTAGGVTVNNIAKWDGSEWSSLGEGVGGIDDFNESTSVHAIAISGTDMYVGGRFDWDSELGYFLYSVAKWNGNSWQVVARMRYPIDEEGKDEKSSIVTSLGIIGTKLYAGGDFIYVDGFADNSLNHVALYKDGIWQTVGGGVGNISTENDVFEGVVRSVTVNGSNIYFGGKFQSAGDVTVNYIARWDGNNWHSLGGD